MGWVCNVVLMNVYFGFWRGEGLGKGWNKGGQFTSNLRPRQTDPVTARRFQVSRREYKRGKRGTGKGR